MTNMPDFKDALVFTGGGTGGHFFPAVALAEGARRQWPDRSIVFIGATRGIEAKRLPESGWPNLLLDVEGFAGRSPIAMIRAVGKLWRARQVLRAAWRDHQPTAVIATGGYGSAPAVLAARSLGIPYFLHESNAQPGMLVKHLGRGAQRVWCGMEAVRGQLEGADCLTVGTPIRVAFLRPFDPLAALNPPFRLLVIGGSGGARALNEAMMKILPGLLNDFPEWEVLHQAGARDFSDLQRQSRHPRHHLEPFLEDMDRVMEASSLVVSRSGASTCAELKACGRPAILVPMPASAGDHQTMNARAMVSEGRAVHVPQGDQLATTLARETARWMGDGSLRSDFASPEANQAVERCLEDLGVKLKI
jgi:UDP-N-acetylglucosamine--N-acetylmuramyl-(pentapeptide) pyrophosphoryl-undecaprenol N-acetylglucosamine transferase